MITRFLRLGGILALCLAASFEGAHAGTLQFTEVSAAAGVNVTNGIISFVDHHDYTGGGAVGDFNNDGFQDLFVISGGTGFTMDWLFINNGDGTFTDRAAEWGLTHVHIGKGASVGDFNNDGWLDLFITSGGTFGRLGPGHHKLYRNNGNGTFTNVATTAGVNFSTGAQDGEDGFGSCFGDYDLDGDLDLFITGFADDSAGNRLYRNNGDETFTDVTVASQLLINTPIDIRGFAPRLVDMDGDRYPDLLLAADFGTSRYFRNNGDGTFADITDISGAGIDENAMGHTVGDFNGDGLLDWYVTSIYWPQVNWTGNKLYLNQGNHTYTEHAAALGVDDGGYGWGTVAVDFNHDGRLDIAETNGDSGPVLEFKNEQSYLWIQNPNGTFSEQAVATGMTHNDRGRGMSNFDYDNDGDQDVVIFAYGDPLRLFRNDLGGSNIDWIRIFLDPAGQPGIPPAGIGAVVTVLEGGTSQVRPILAGDNFLSTSELSAHFGLGNTSSVDTIRVDWPDGSVTTLQDVTPNRTLTIAAGPREQNCTNTDDDDNDGLTDCDDPDCCGLPGCQSGQGVCCTNANDCDDTHYCNGAEQCIDDLCVTSAAPCVGQACDEGGNACVECTIDADCDDGSYCNGAETCSGSTCSAGAAPCGGGLCNDAIDACVECLEHADCADDGFFCNGTEVCAQGICESAFDTCPGRPCDEGGDTCIGPVDLQARVGAPMHRLTGSELARFEAGKASFQSILTEPSGLGPIYNATACAACHAAPDGSGNAAVTSFGEDDGQGGVDALPGGPLLQALATSGSCLETLPPQADVTTTRLSNALAGTGLIDALDDATIYGYVSTPPGGGVSGRTQIVPILEEPGETAVGRFGWKSQAPTALSMTAAELRDQLGVTNPLLPDESAPNGNQLLLSICDTVSDPEDAGGTLAAVTDYVRFLADPPQTPRNGMTGATLFGQTGCGYCHSPLMWTKPDPRLEYALYFQFVNPYSDFLLHDMGAAGEEMERGDALPGESRTTPLWGLRWRDAMWHDGRFSGGTWESRVRAAIAEHDVAGSEGATSAQAFAALTAGDQDAIVAFLDSLGRAEFDHDGDNDVDAADKLQFDACFSGPGSFYTADDPCAISDVDQDGDVDFDDGLLFDLAADGPSGRTDQVLVERLAGGDLRLQWNPSCSVADTDYATYEGTLGSFSSHLPVTCSTTGLTSHDLTPSAGDTYYLTVPSTGFREGSYGKGAGGAERAPSAAACETQAPGACP